VTATVRRRLRIALVIVLIAAGGYAAARIKRDFWDFEVIHKAGSRVIAAEPLYRPNDGHYQYKYWPIFAVAMTPFATIPVEVGKVIWYTLTVACLVIFVNQTIRALPDRRLSVQLLTWAALLLTGKFIVKELVNGQTNVMLGVLVMLALAAAERGQRVRAGMFVALAAFAKPYGLMFVPWIAATQGIAGLAGALGMLVAGWMAPALVYGWQGNLSLLSEWYRTVVQTTPPNLVIAENISFATMWAKWIGVGPAAAALATATALVSFGGALWLWIGRNRVSRPGYLEIGYLLVLIPLISPQGWDYVLVAAMPAYVCLVDRFGRSSRSWQLATAVGFFLTSFTIYDLVGRTLYFALMSSSAVSVGALLLCGSLLRLRLSGVS
jgi:hypothetical protein